MTGLAGESALLAFPLICERAASGVKSGKKRKSDTGMAFSFKEKQKLSKKP